MADDEEPDEAAKAARWKDSALYRVRRIATSDFDASQRFDAWRETAYSVVDLVAPRGAETDMVGVKRNIRGALGTFATQEGSEHQTAFSAAASLSGAAEVVVISVMAEGNVGLDSPDGTQLITPTGRLVAYDATRPMRYHWSQGKEIYVVIPRAKALEALGGELPSLALPLDTNPLGEMVREQMIALDRHAERLDPKETAVALDALHALIFLLLQRVGRQLIGSAEGEANSLFSAAKLYMQMHYGTVGLTPDVIAHALGCSRATLYRAFTRNDTTVMDTLRDIRLVMSRKFIETGAERSLTAIARRCGFTDSNTFGKQFRTRFGVSPAKWKNTFG